MHLTKNRRDIFRVHDGFSIFLPFGRYGGHTHLGRLGQSTEAKAASINRLVAAGDEGKGRLRVAVVQQIFCWWMCLKCLNMLY